MATGSAIEIYKEVGYPTDVSKAFDLAEMGGTHAIGHTRMATELAVTTIGSHPVSTGADQCLVHNRSLSNHNDLRRELIQDGMTFETQTTQRSRPPISLAHERGNATWASHSTRASRIWMASSPSSSVPRTVSVSCAIRSPASRPSWRRPINTSLSARNTAHS